MILILKFKQVHFFRKKFISSEKILYTNGDADYAKKLLNALGLDGIFYDIFDIRKSNYIPKPMKNL